MKRDNDKRLKELEQKNKKLRDQLDQQASDLTEKNRELEIEAALERVRSRAMALHKTDELHEVLATVTAQLESLGSGTEGAAIIIYDEELAAEHWMTGYSGDYPESYKIPYVEHPYFTDLLHAWQEGVPFQEFYFEGDLKIEYGKWCLENSDFKRMPPEFKKEMLNPERMVISDAFNKYGMIEVIGPEPLSEDSINILKRFSKVFEQAYTRFLDIQKAEEQAREAQIEAALEKVRSVSLAMHRSDDLENVVVALFDKLLELEISFDGAFIIIAEKAQKIFQVWVASRYLSHPVNIQIPYDSKIAKNKIVKDIWSVFDTGQSIINRSYSGKDKNDYFRFHDEINKSKVPEDVIKLHQEQETWTVSFIGEKNSIIGFDSWTGQTIDEENVQILKRFVRVFEQAYVRFLDLQKAEEQAREAEIELALERVRARTMAMQHSDELVELNALLIQQVHELDIPIFAVGIHICDPDKPVTQTWIGHPEEGQMPKAFIDHSEDPLCILMYDGWKNGEEFVLKVMEGDDLKEHFQRMSNYIPEHQVFENMDHPDRLYYHMAYFSYGFFVFNTSVPSPENHDVFKRFAKVFEQTYTRFLDLKKAEEQAREARIEAALERVRSRSLGMQSTGDLTEVMATVFQQLEILGIDAIGCSLPLRDKDGGAEFWFAGFQDVNYPQSYKIDYFDHPYFNEQLKAWKKGIDFKVFTFEGALKKSYDEYIFNHTGFSKLPPEVKEGLASLEKAFISNAFMKYGAIEIVSIEPLPEEKNNILKRFAKVFEQSYTRFLDLKKAEEQARESQIEAALERVRSRSMGMQSSSELGEILGKIFEELRSLDVELDRCFIWVIEPENEGVHCWIASPESGSASYWFPFFDHPYFQAFMDVWREQKKLFKLDIQGKLKKSWDQYLFEITEFRNLPLEAIESMRQPEQIHTTSIANKYGLLCTASLDSMSEESIGIFRRFGAVFEQSYTRFEDIRKAEEQAREAQIEAALERVRSRSMGMQSSDELREVVQVMYNEVDKLDISRRGCLIMIFDDERQHIQSWLSELAQGKYASSFDFTRKDHDVVRQWWDFWESDKNRLSLHFRDEQKFEFDSYLFKNTGLKKLPEEVKTDIINEHEVYFEYIKMDYGMIEFIDVEPFSEESIPVLERITKVFNQAYTRFQDIQRAEKLALETARQSSLDRIRAEIASMRSAEDLNQITPLIWDELKTLEIPFIRCGVFIMDEEKGVSHTYLSTPKGESIAALHLPLEGISHTENVYASWKKQQIYTEHWDKQGFREWTKNLIDRELIDSKERYEAGSAPENLYLHFLPFKQGMLYIGNTEPLSKESLDLGQSLADAFSVAYDRYDDFNKIEQALKELEAAKEQLVQQEKLASLGQLTSGIAHEIKNPLNFVNNFSELSAELIQEARDEIETVRAYRDTPLPDDAMDEMSAILDDIETNLKTIHKHGTRADGIVKSMLQHSRGGSGKMEPTNVNSLIKEYANLAFHGMRAGKDPIDVDIELDLDKNVGEVEMIAEDFSRVILNLCNNAFDAMREKANSKRETADDYEPKLSIRTHQNDQSITIEIQDNGPGIPNDIKDKILQPFFTTKKGTAGTGLGLSITNDIIKAHGGSLALETDSSGTTFTITINP